MRNSQALVNDDIIQRGIAGRTRLQWSTSSAIVQEACCLASAAYSMLQQAAMA